MAVTGWVLVQAEVGRARAVKDAIAALDAQGVTVLSADNVTGPHDIIVRMQADDLDTLNNCVGSHFSAIPGVTHTITCLTFGS